MRLEAGRTCGAFAGFVVKLRVRGLGDRLGGCCGLTADSCGRTTMVIIGVVISVAIAGAFLAVGLLVLYGGLRATQRQLLPGFLPDRPGPLQRGLTLLALWGPIGVVALFCIITAVEIVRIALAALG